MSQLPQSPSELLGRWTRHYCLAPLAGAVLSGKYTLVPTMIAALRTKSDRPQESWCLLVRTNNACGNHSRRSPYGSVYFSLQSHALSHDDCWIEIASGQRLLHLEQMRPSCPILPSIVPTNYATYGGHVTQQRCLPLE